MIRADNQPTKYQTQFTNGEHISTSDTTADKGGTNLGFRPHELLEAALATCMNITVRMAAEKYAIPLTGVSITVSLNRKEPEVPVFEYSVQFAGVLSESQKARLLAAAGRCPVRNTLSQSLRFMSCV